MKQHLFSAIERLTATSNITLWNITDKNIDEFKSRKDLMIRFSKQFGNDSDGYSRIYKNYVNKEDDDDDDKWFKEITKQIKDKSITYFFFIKNDDEIIGYLYLIENLKYFHDTVHISSLFIDVNHRGKGYGTLVMHQIMDFVKHKSPYKHISLNVLEGNTAARKLYKKFGFEDISHTMFKEAL